MGFECYTFLSGGKYLGMQAYQIWNIISDGIELEEDNITANTINNYFTNDGRRFAGAFQLME